MEPITVSRNISMFTNQTSGWPPGQLSPAYLHCDTSQPLQTQSYPKENPLFHKSTSLPKFLLILYFSFSRTLLLISILGLKLIVIIFYFNHCNHLLTGLPVISFPPPLICLPKSAATMMLYKMQKGTSYYTFQNPVVHYHT